MKIKMELGWIFPYEEIEKTSEIILYGAGNVGKSFFKQLQSTKYCEIKMWVDIKDEYYRSQGLPVCNPAEIPDDFNSKIVIAIGDRKVCESVVQYLLKRGTNKENIWSPYKENKIINAEMADDIYDEKRNREPREFNINNIDVAFVIPNPIKGGGGHRNIFRAVKYLKEFGHDVTVYYTQSETDEKTMKTNVSKWFYSMEDIVFIKYRGHLGYHDAVFATWWETAYLVQKEQDKFKQCFYFVQDFEPFFYPVSSNYYLAENTYRLGFAHICSGPWCEKMLKERYQAEAVSFQFPLDTNIYNENYKRTKLEKNIIFFAKPELSRRCFELGIKALEVFHRQMPEVEIILYGSKQLYEGIVSFKATILNILPRLEDLAELYANADVGIVFSTTNPSLVPYEMMSCGCPVVDLNLDYAISKYGNCEDNVFLLDVQPEKFAKELLEIIGDDELREKKRKSASVWVKKEFPSEYEMARKVESSMKAKLLNGVME